MFKMKNQVIIFFLAMFLLGGTSIGTSQVRLGVKAGLNLANLNYDGFVLDIDNKILPSFLAGVVLEFDFSEHVGLGTGLQYHGKGAKSDVDDDSQVSMGYLQVPLQLQYRGNGFFAAVGPYVAYAISGKTKDGGVSEDLSFGSSIEDDFAALDFGANLELGFEFSPLRATAFYSLGLANGVPADLQDFFTDASIKHGVFGVALTYLFGGN
jgi:hypothetical protein